MTSSKAETRDKFIDAQKEEKKTYFLEKLNASVLIAPSEKSSTYFDFRHWFLEEFYEYRLGRNTQ